MGQRIVTIFLAVAILLSLTLLGSKVYSFRLPDNQQGYEPDQPIAYSHRLHAGELQMNCLYCHSAAQTSRHAAIPSADKCMRCHGFVTAAFNKVLAEDYLAKEQERPVEKVVSPELQKLYDALALDDELNRDPNKQPKSIEWVRIHNLPDYVYFNHSAHVNADVTCQTCHGPIQTMERVRQFETLSMGWCVNCHRDTAKNGISGKAVNPSIDCVTCHY